jgi:hypothetical protein
MKYKPIPGHENDIDPKELEDPFENRKYGWILRFTVSTFFGCLISGLIFVLILHAVGRNPDTSDSFLSSKYIHAFWILPLVWGVLGTFFFETMMESAMDLLKTHFRSGH